MVQAAARVPRVGSLLDARRVHRPFEPAGSWTLSQEEAQLRRLRARAVFTPRLLVPPFAALSPLTSGVRHDAHARVERRCNSSVQTKAKQAGGSGRRALVLVCFAWIRITEVWYRSCRCTSSHVDIIELLVCHKICTQFAEQMGKSTTTKRLFVFRFADHFAFFLSDRQGPEPRFENPSSQRVLSIESQRESEHDCQLADPTRSFWWHEGAACQLTPHPRRAV